MKFGLLGARLGHSLSPQIHQEVFRQLDIEATYELIEVPTEKLADKVAELRKNYRGLNVTIPHKVAVMDSLDYIAAEARAIGAVNTILFKDGRASGFNTDYFGFGLQVLIRIISALPGCLNIMDWCPKEKMSVCWEPAEPAGQFSSALRI